MRRRVCGASLGCGLRVALTSGGWPVPVGGGWRHPVGWATTTCGREVVTTCGPGALVPVLNMFSENGFSI